MAATKHHEQHHRPRQHRCLVATLLLTPFAILTLLGILFSMETINLSGSTAAVADNTAPPSAEPIPTPTSSPPNETQQPAVEAATFPPLEHPSAPPIPTETDAAAVDPSSTFPPLENPTATDFPTTEPESRTTAPTESPTYSSIETATTTNDAATFPPLEHPSAPPIPTETDAAVEPPSTFPPLENPTATDFPTTEPESHTTAPTESPSDSSVETATTASDVLSVLNLIFNVSGPSPSTGSDTTTFPPLPSPSSSTSILDYLTLRPTGTITMAPTKAPFAEFDFDESKRFRLRMHWELDYFWQEEEHESWWCIACTTCRELNFGQQGEGCKRVDRCSQGDQIWLQPCRHAAPHNGEAFGFVDIGEDFHQIKNHRTNLCLERTLTRYVTLEPCGDPLHSIPMRQLWFGMRDDGEPFEIRPALESNDPEPFCLTQQHHPKNFEIVALKECQWAHFFDTGLWQQYKL